MRSRRAKAVVVVVVGLLAALIISTRRNPTYQSRALVSGAVVAASGRNSIEQELAVARSEALRTVVQARHGSAEKVDVGVVDGVLLEFRVRSRDRISASEQANTYAQAYVELRQKQLAEQPLPERVRQRPETGDAPTVVVPARPAGSPASPWPSESWTFAGLILIALALAIPERDSGE